MLRWIWNSVAARQNINHFIVIHDSFVKLFPSTIMRQTKSVVKGMVVIALCVFKPAESDTVQSLICPYLKRAPPHPPEGAVDWQKFFIPQHPLMVDKHTNTCQNWSRDTPLGILDHVEKVVEVSRLWKQYTCKILLYFGITIWITGLFLAVMTLPWWTSDRAFASRV